MNKKLGSIILNSLIVIFEIIGLIVVMKTNNHISIEYYTEDSNILALFSSLIYVGFLLLKGHVPKWGKILKYTTTVCLAVTFLVVIFVLAPMYNFDYNYLLFKDGLLYQHLICPVLCFITFFLFDDMDKLTLKDNFLSLSLTLVYGFILIILNILDIVKGPYPFLMVKEQSILVSCMWFIIIDSLAFVIALVLRILKNKLIK